MPPLPPLRLSSLALPLLVRESSSSADLRAAAALRAASFYTYPAGRSAFAAASHQRMKLDAEWASLEAKTRGSEPAYAALSVVCLLALLPLPADADAAAALCAGVDASCRLPAEAEGPPLFAAGTLDLNVGAALPCEELVGARPGRRAYLSNVAVASGARRRGVGRALLAAARQAAAGRGCHHLYVHVVADNEPAAALYRQQGFSVECEEGAALARNLGRPRRLLLHAAVDERDDAPSV